VDDALAVVHQHRPREVVGRARQASLQELVQDSAQIAQARGLGACQVDVTRPI
jgi:hypothetical protein